MSTFDDLFTAALPSVFGVFGDLATHVDASGNATEAMVIKEQIPEQFGEFGERVDPLWSIECPSSLGAIVGDTFYFSDGVNGAQTAWLAEQVMTKDAITVRFAVREV